MLISEIFYSIQGEGLAAGFPCIFVRLAGCNLRCQWCDTPYASWNPQGRNLSIVEILAECSAFPCKRVVITGGEPFLFQDLPDLCLAFRRAGFEIHLESAGTIFQSIELDLLTISPKLASSLPDAMLHPTWHAKHLAILNDRKALVQLIREYGNRVSLKFVISAEDDLYEIESFLSILPSISKDQILFMPQARTSIELDTMALKVVDLCLRHGYRYGDRLHIRLWNDKRGV